MDKNALVDRASQLEARLTTWLQEQLKVSLLLVTPDIISPAITTATITTTINTTTSDDAKNLPRLGLIWQFMMSLGLVTSPAMTVLGQVNDCVLILSRARQHSGNSLERIGINLDDKTRKKQESLQASTGSIIGGILEKSPGSFEVT